MLKTILKLSFAGILLCWLISAGKLSMGAIYLLLDHPAPLLLMIAIMIFNCFTTSYRWKLLLELETQESISLIAATKVTWIGLFFNTFLPGAVTGDLVKVVYAKSLNKKLTNSYLITSTLLDRVFGLVGIILLLGFFSWLNHDLLINKSPEIAQLIHVNYLLSVGVCVFLLILFLPQNITKHLARICKKFPLIGNKIAKLLESFWLIGRFPKTTVMAIIISVFTQFLNVFAFWVITLPFINGISLFTSMSFIPIGFITTAIPISPGGLGVGHAAFSYLYQQFGVSNGADLFNAFFVSWLIVNLLGAIPYLLTSKKSHPKN